MYEIILELSKNKATSGNISTKTLKAIAYKDVTTL